MYLPTTPSASRGPMKYKLERTSVAVDDVDDDIDG